MHLFRYIAFIASGIPSVLTKKSNASIKGTNSEGSPLNDGKSDALRGCLMLRLAKLSLRAAPNPDVSRVAFCVLLPPGNLLIMVLTISQRLALSSK